MESESEHRKVKYTKMVIRESLFGLLETERLQKITIKRLCELADINRGTFYLHYTDINDLVEKLEEVLIDSITGTIRYEQIGEKDQQKMFCRILTHIRDRIDEYRILFLNPASSRCLDRIIEGVYEHHAAALISKNQPISKNEIDYTFALLSSGCAQVILKWVKNDFEESPEYMAELINRFVECGFASHRGQAMNPPA